MAPYLSIKGFIAEQGIPRGLLYQMVKAGTAPRITRIGRRLFISREAIDEWRQRAEGACISTQPTGGRQT
jgi:predicted DNA-binding transcriptional regulator AlpA